MVHESLRSIRRSGVRRPLLLSLVTEARCKRRGSLHLRPRAAANQSIFTIAKVKRTKVVVNLESEIGLVPGDPERHLPLCGCEGFQRER